MVAHQLAEVDIVPLVDGCKGSSDDDADASPAFALSRCLSAGACAFTLSRNDYFEVSLSQSVLTEHAQAVVHETGVGVFCDFRRVVVKTYPSGGHGIGVDVVKQVVNR